MNRQVFKFDYLTCRSLFFLLYKIFLKIEREKNTHNIKITLKPLLLFDFIRFSSYVCLRFILKDHIKDTFRQSDNRHYMTKTKADDVIFSLGFFDGLK